MINLKLYDKDGTTLLGLLPEPISFQIAAEFSEIGALSFEYPSSGVNASLISVMNEIAVTNEDGTEYANGRFVVTGVNGDRTRPDSKLTISARSLLWRFDTALAYPDGGIASGEVMRTFVGATAGEILKTLIDDAHTRTALSGITYSFSNTVDSLSVAWPDTTDTDYQARSSILSVIRSLSDLGLVEVETNARVLKATSSDGLGVDRTTGATPIILRTGLNIFEAPEDTNADRLGSVALVEGDEMVIFERSNSPAVTSYGRLESAFTTSGVADQIVMEAMSDAYLSTIAAPARQLTIGLAMVAGQPEPFKDFNVGDYIYTATSQGLERVRVRQITLSKTSGKLTASVTLGDRIYENEIRIARKMAAITSGSVNLGNGTTPTITPVAVPDTLAPSAPTSLAATSTGYIDNKLPRSSVALTWTAPTTNTDATALTDLSSYHVERRTDPAGAWEFSGTSGTNALTISGLEPSINHYFRVSALDAFGNKSAPSASLTHSAAAVSTAPATVSAPTLSVKLGTITVKWDGLNSIGGAMASDFAYVDVHRSTSTAFTPSNSTKVGRFSGKDVAVFSDLVIGTTYYFKLVAYNTSGLSSSASSEASIAATGISGPDIEANAITANKIDAGAITAAKMSATAIDGMTVTGATVRTAASGARVEMTSSGLTAYDSGGTPTFNINSSTGAVTIGAYATTSAVSTAQSTANTAVSNASTAQGTANTAVSNAATAQSTANGKITAGGAAADVNAGSVTISGGKITAGTITATEISGSYVYAGTLNANNITTGTLSAVSINITSGSYSLTVGSSGAYAYLSVTPGNATGISMNAVGFVGSTTAGWSSHCYPYADNTYALGIISPSNYRWSRVYAVNTTISSSDARIKTAVEDASLGLDFINALRPVSYKFINGGNTVNVDENGDVILDENGVHSVTAHPGVRRHWGLIAQEVKAVIDAAGVEDFAGWCIDDVTNPDGMQSLSYEQFISPMIKAIQELTIRIETLEAA